MDMIAYFVVFAALGFLLSSKYKSHHVDYMAIVGIAILWGIVHGLLWGFVSFLELIVGSAIAKGLFNKAKKPEEDE